MRMCIVGHLFLQRNYEDLWPGSICAQPSPSWGDSIREDKTRLNLASFAMMKLERIWKIKNISLQVKIRLYISLVHSVLLYLCEGWMLNVELERTIQAFEFKSYRKIPCISYTERRANEGWNRKLPPWQEKNNHSCLPWKEESLPGIIMSTTMIPLPTPSCRVQLKTNIEEAGREHPGLTTTE